MEADTHTTIPHPQRQIKLTNNNKDYTIRSSSPDNISLTIYNKTTYQIYSVNNFHLKNINSHALELAIQGNNQMISLQETESTIQNIKFIVLKITINSTFLSQIQQQIFCQFSSSLNQDEIITEQLNIIKQKLIDFSNRISGIGHNSQRFFVAECLNQKSCGSHNDTEDVASLILPEGDYLITVSFFLFTTEWLYAGLTQQKFQNLQILNPINPFDQNQGFYSIPQSWVPVVHTFIHKVIGNTRITYQLMYGSSYPCSVRNFIMTAERYSVN